MKIQIKTPAFISRKKTLLAVEFYDKLTLTKLSERKIQILKKSGYKIPTNDENLAYLAAACLHNLKPGKYGVKIEIEKNIPSFSGLNSQAGNAAGVLIALNKLWKLNLKSNELLTIAQKIDPRIKKILKVHFEKKSSAIKSIILIHLRYIQTDRDWTEEKAFQHFPDIKQVSNHLKKIGAENCGMSGKGPMIYGIFQDLPKNKKWMLNLTKKIDFLWTGKTCNGRFKLIN